MAWHYQRKYGALSSLGERWVIWKEETPFRGLIIKGKQEEISEFSGLRNWEYHKIRSMPLVIPLTPIIRPSSTVPTEEGAVELGDAVSQPLGLGSHGSRVWDQGLYASQVITRDRSDGLAESQRKEGKSSTITLVTAVGNSGFSLAEDPLWSPVEYSIFCPRERRSGYFITDLNVI